MKNLYLKFHLLFLLFVFLSSCEKKKEIEPVTFDRDLPLIIGGKTFTLASFRAISYGQTVIISAFSKEGQSLFIFADQLEKGNVYALDEPRIRLEYLDERQQNYTPLSGKVALVIAKDESTISFKIKAQLRGFNNIIEIKEGEIKNQPLKINAQRDYPIKIEALTGKGIKYWSQLSFIMSVNPCWRNLPFYLDDDWIFNADGTFEFLAGENRGAFNCFNWPDFKGEWQFMVENDVIAKLGRIHRYPNGSTEVFINEIEYLSEETMSLLENFNGIPSGRNFRSSEQ